MTTDGPLFDLFPGNGGYVDLDGTSDAEANLSTIMSFAAGSYTLSFDLAGNARDDGSKTTVITLGNFTTQITLASNDPYALHTLTFTTTGGNLVFSDLSGGNNNIGNILDNVTVGHSHPRASDLGHDAAWLRGPGLRVSPITAQGVVRLICSSTPQKGRHQAAFLLCEA